jgi:hypothetical protein
MHYMTACKVRHKDVANNFVPDKLVGQDDKLLGVKDLSLALFQASMPLRITSYNSPFRLAIAIQFCSWQY